MGNRPPRFNNPSRLAASRVVCLLASLVFSCAVTEGARTLEPRVVAIAPAPVGVERVPLSIGKFANKSQFGQGLFSNGEDTLGMQGRQILTTHLSESGRFLLLDRSNLEELEREGKLAGSTAQPTGAELLITGAVTEFGRREVGAQAFGGLLGKSKTQVAYAKVSISAVSVSNSAILFTAQGAGETTLTQQQIIGFGSSASYDSTLTDKVLNRAIAEAVNDLVISLDAGSWSAK